MSLMLLQGVLPLRDCLDFRSRKLALRLLRLLDRGEHVPANLPYRAFIYPFAKHSPYLLKILAVLLNVFHVFRREGLHGVRWLLPGGLPIEKGLERNMGSPMDRFHRRETPKLESWLRLLQFTPTIQYGLVDRRVDKVEAVGRFTGQHAGDLLICRKQQNVDRAHVEFVRLSQAGHPRKSSVVPRITLEGFQQLCHPRTN